jgi:hypothetical protein
MIVSLRTATVCFLLSLALGCGKGGDAPAGGGSTDKPKTGDASDKEKSSYLKQYGIAYLNHMDTMDIGPSKADDLATYVEKDVRLLKPLRAGEYVLIWDVTVPDQKNGYKGAGDLVLGYVKDVPTKGGPVLLGDGKVVQMTAEEFSKAKKAMPSPKKD